NGFTELLAELRGEPAKFQPLVKSLWDTMNKGGFSPVLRDDLLRFNGGLFEDVDALAVTGDQLALLIEAAKADWKDVEPAIFGTLLERALDPQERHKLGAHYTPRAYVERLVMPTVIEPLRGDWDNVKAAAVTLAVKGETSGAIDEVKAFHQKLCETRVLDPACGSGNFLYVTMEHMKRLEGEVLDLLRELGDTQYHLEMDRHSVDPHQFLGIEVNPRAAVIAELVLWIGYLQWHFRTKGAAPSEPILRAFNNIQVIDAVLEADVELARDEKGKPLRHGDSEQSVYRYKNPRRPDWPTAEFIVGNPPFIGGKDIRARLGDEYAEALWKSHPRMNDSADFIMYWWDRAADLLTGKGTVLRRFGLVSTNSISQVFQRRVMERHLKAKKAISLVMAVPDHPWTKATKDSAAVRIAMTVGEAGSREGTLREVTRESALDTDAPIIEFKEGKGAINSDLTIGIDLAQAKALISNEGLCSRGMSLHGDGFIVTPEQAEYLGLGKRKGLDQHIRAYRNGRDLTARPRGVMVIDLFGLDADDVRKRFPEVYQHVKAEVKEKIVVKHGEEEKVGRNWNNRATYRDNWWIFGEPRSELRPALSGLPRYIATVETAKHRVFQFLDAAILPDNMLVAIASSDGFDLGILSSRIHCLWAVRAGGWLGMGNDPRYSKSRCFDPFPLPAATDARKAAIRAIAEELDAHRKRVLAEHAHLTLTGLYNVREKLRTGTKPGALNADDRQIFDDGLVLILKELHDKLDRAVADAYGWPADLSEEDILARLVALNKDRAAEEARGQVRWLRPEYQIPRFGKPGEKAEQIEADLGSEIVTGKKPTFPADDMGQTAAVMAALAAGPGPSSPAALAATFRQGKRVENKVQAVLLSLSRMGVIANGKLGGTFRLHRIG
ncbi:MAG: class I SAM-dependent DNA methyltransferase, partial [Dongiaceae bacterium]